MISDRTLGEIWNRENLKQNCLLLEELLHPARNTIGSLVSVPTRLIFFQKYSNPLLLLGIPRLLSFLLCQSNWQAICKKKYLLNKKVISKASLKILEVNIHVWWSISLISRLTWIHVSNHFVIVCNIQIVVRM